jgi:hypothetical protein
MADDDSTDDSTEGIEAGIEAGSEAQNPGWWAGRRRVRMGYLVVLASVAISYSLCALQSTTKPSTFAICIQLATVAVVFRVAGVHRILRRTVDVVLLVAAASIIATAVFNANNDSLTLDIALSAASMIFYLICPVVIIGHQVRRNAVDLQTLLAAIAAYILIGMSFTFVFNLYGLISAQPVFGSGAADSLSVQLFFSFSTLTTTGYGNIVPITSFGQSVAVMEAITGQMFLVVAMARIVSMWKPVARGRQ